MNKKSSVQETKLVIYGAWYFSKVVAESAALSGWEVLGFVDPDPPPETETLSGVPEDSSVVVAIGDNSVRSIVCARLEQAGRKLVSIFHPTAMVSPSASIGAGCYLAEYAVVRANSSIGSGTILNSGSVVSHDCRVDSYVTFGPNAATGGHVSIGARTLIGVGASVRPHSTVSSDCIVGAGSVVVKDVTAGQSVVGVPARSIQPASKPAKQSDWGSNLVW